MIGPTGVGKTEIARRLARLAQAPFLKVEATKFTEVGYVGRDVEQIIRDLVEIAISMTRDRLRKEVAAKAELAAEERLLDTLVGENAAPETRTKFRQMLRGGELDEREVEIQVSDSGGLQLPTMDIPGMPGAQMGMINLNEIFGKALRRRAHQEAAHERRARRMRGADRAKRATSCSIRKTVTAEAHGRGRAERHRLPGRNRQDHRPLRARSAPTSAARAYSATCCR